MARIFECPKCGTDISDTYEGDDPSVGINAGWFCDTCNEGFGDADGPEPHDDDVGIFGTGGLSTLDRCPKCLSTNLEMGFGLAGGGFGPYTFCSQCGVVVSKSQDPT